MFADGYRLGRACDRYRCRLTKRNVKYAKIRQTVAGALKSPFLDWQRRDAVGFTQSVVPTPPSSKMVDGDLK